MNKYFKSFQGKALILRMARERSIDTLTVDGGILCLNFVNTVYAWKGKNLHEYLQSYDDVILWCKKLEILDGNALDQLKSASEQNPDQAIEALLKIKSLRLVFYKIFSAIALAETGSIAADVMNEFNKYMSLAFSGISYRNTIEKIEKTYEYQDDPLLTPLMSVLFSANGLLTSKDYSLVKECPHCGWLFIDTTKNKKKVWCSPASCGSNDKAKRYYSRVKLDRK